MIGLNTFCILFEIIDQKDISKSVPANLPI